MSPEGLGSPGELAIFPHQRQQARKQCDPPTIMRCSRP